MADISKINVKGTEYNLKDAWAREQLAKGIKFYKCTIAGDTPYGVHWKSGDATIIGTLTAKDALDPAKTPVDRIHAIYLVPGISKEGNDIFNEYVVIGTGEAAVWEKFGDTEIDFSSLGEFAFADKGTATVASKSVTSTGNFTPTGEITGGGFTGASTTFTGSCTPLGDITGGTFTGDEGEISVSGTSTGGISGGKFTGSSTTFTGSYTPEGTVSATFKGDAATISGSASYTPAGSISGCTFEGTEGDVSVSGTTTGSVTSTFKGTAGTVSVSGTPKGHNASSSVTISPKTTSVVTAVGGDEDYVASVAGEVLTFANKTYVYNTKATSTASVWSGYNSATAAAQAFTGESTTFTGSHTPVGTVSSTFKGASMTSTGKFTPEGTITGCKFTGTPATISISDSYTPAGSITASFKGAPATISVSGTPLGSVSAIGFVGKPITLTGTFTPTGSISGCKFTGKSTSVSVSGTPKGSNAAITFKGKSGSVSVSGTVGSQTITVNPVKK